MTLTCHLILILRDGSSSVSRSDWENADEVDATHGMKQGGTRGRAVEDADEQGIVRELDSLAVSS